jgi:hypothetical protein
VTALAGALPHDPVFSREYGCTETEWLGWMPGATQGLPLQHPGPDRLVVAIGGGRLTLSWQPLTPRVIALVRLPRLSVHFAFDGVDLDQRLDFLRRFDRHLQRGGG